MITKVMGQLGRITMNSGVPEDREPRVVQTVTAIAGFAYGVIGADIHIFGDGSPVYLLHNWTATMEPDASWLRELPSRMLNARFEVVGFTGRDVDLAQLRRWRDEGPRLAARWIHGPGGAGKTRLAAQFSAESVAAGWKVVVASHGPGAVSPPAGSQDLRRDGEPGLVMIVDYADRWPLAHLTWLLSNALLHQVGVVTRILLLARTLDAWPGVRATLSNHQSGTSSHTLEPLPDADRHRTQMFTAARDGFAARYGVHDVDAIGPPGSLMQPDMGLILALHMAALVAVDAHVEGRRPPSDMAGLAVYLLDREHLHWVNLYGDRTHELDSSGRSYQTTPQVMNRLVFSASLAGPVARSAGPDILDHIVPEIDVDQVLADHATCYPPADPAQALEPLYPDRLAEDFLALTIPGHPADYPAQPWAPVAVHSLLGRTAQGTPQIHTPRSVTFLAAAAARWPHLGWLHLFPLLHQDPQLAVDAGSAALVALAGIENLDVTVLEAIVPLLPTDQHIDLDVGAAAVARRLITELLAVATTDTERAALHASLAWRLTNAGQYDEALVAIQRAAKLHRSLTGTDQQTHMPELAADLNNLGIILAELGQWQEALAPSEEAVEIRQRLADADPNTHLPDLAASLSNLGGRLRELGRIQQAQVLAEQAADTHRRLFLADPDRHKATLAAALGNLGILLAESGRPNDALAATQEATDFYQELARTNPSRYLPELAMSLTDLGMRWSALGRPDEGLPPTEAAIAASRRLATANPHAYLPNLARALDHLGVLLAEARRDEESLTPVLEAVATYRQLVRTNPAAHLPSLAWTLSNLGGMLGSFGHAHDALAPTREAEQIRCQLAGANPDAYLPDLATSVHNLGVVLSDLGRQREALTNTREAVALRRQLAEASPDAYLPPLAMSLNSLGCQLAQMGQAADALDPALEAVQIYRLAAERNPDAHLPELTRALSNLGGWLEGLGWPPEGLQPAREAVDIHRWLIEINPEAHESNLANWLWGYALILLNIGTELADALDAITEAITMYPKLTGPRPDSYNEDLRSMHQTKADILQHLPPDDHPRAD